MFSGQRPPPARCANARGGGSSENGRRWLIARYTKLGCRGQGEAAKESWLDRALLDGSVYMGDQAPELHAPNNGMPSDHAPLWGDRVDIHAPRTTNEQGQLHRPSFEGLVLRRANPRCPPREALVCSVANCCTRVQKPTALAKPEERRGRSEARLLRPTQLRHAGTLCVRRDSEANLVVLECCWCGVVVAGEVAGCVGTDDTEGLGRGRWDEVA